MPSSLQTMIRDLHRRRARDRRGLALAEGVRLVEEALAAGMSVRGAAVSPTLEATARGRALKAALERAGARLEVMDDGALERLADTESPQGVVAVIQPRQWDWEDLRASGRAPVVALAGVQDPGNVGTILRTAFALGAAGAVALPGTAELNNPKVVRASMGAAFRIPALAGTVEAFLAWAAAGSIELWAAAADGDPVGATPRSARPIALILGNEGAGIPPALAGRAARRVAVPLAPRAGVESLNVAVAAAILLYEVTRER
jgi:TrmH family RNA methyltransferase